MAESDEAAHVRKRTGTWPATRINAAADDRRRMDAQGRLQGHRLRDRRRDRQDHDLPARGAQRLSSPDALRAVDGPSSAARDDPEIGVVILTGEGPDAFCSGGDQRIRGDDGYLGDDEVAERGIGRLNVLDLQIQIRRLPKPVIAMVAGYAIGGGHVLHLVCDLTIAADNARFGQTGPEGRQLRRWLRRRAAGADHRAQAGEGDLVPLSPVRRRAGARLGPRQRRRPSRPTSRTRPSLGAEEILALSPIALRMLKAGFNAADDGLAGIQQLAGDATMLFYMSEEGQEGRNAYVEKRRPDFSRFPRRP